VRERHGENFLVHHFHLLPLQAEEFRNAGTMKIQVQQPDLHALQRQCQGQVHGHRAFSDAAFAGQDHDFVPDHAHPLLQLPAFLVFSKQLFPFRSGSRSGLSGLGFNGFQVFHAVHFSL
jgi:hypothetical protein